MKHPLYVIFLWHMHQPYYSDPVTGKTGMPWVRLHGIKDYLDMVAILDGFPGIRQTFNLVPSLIDQLQDCASGRRDYFFELSRKPAGDLTQAEKEFMLVNFFMANWDTMVSVHHRYRTLLLKRGKYIAREEIPAISRSFTSRELLDLQVWFNLCWFDPSYIEQDNNLKALVRKQEDFTEKEKLYVLDKQVEITGKIIPKYAESMKAGKIEVSTSPYYHPILPLLCDTDIARVAMEKAPLPERFSHPEDAVWQVNEAVKKHTGVFGVKPEGMWPSEGSVSEAALGIMIDAGIKWVAADEDILFRSLGAGHSRRELYLPYVFERGQGKLSMIFRDRELSDSIGFKYKSWEPSSAAGNLISKLLETGKGAGEEPHAASIILDGENCWEYYRSDGREFLMRLYEGISKEESLKAVTVSEYLRVAQPGRRLEYVFPGSWINADFGIWIGDEEENTSWEYLKKTREAVERASGNAGKAGKEELEKAWRQVYIAEGSDWNWWYGEAHSSANDEEFDTLYRKHLKNAYKLIGEKAPDFLDEPIRRTAARPVVAPVGFFTPEVDGIVSNYYEWIQAGYLRTRAAGGTMHQTESVVSGVYYGFDKENVHFRVDFNPPFDDTRVRQLKVTLVLQGMARNEVSVLLTEKGAVAEAVLLRAGDSGTPEPLRNHGDAAYKKILEVSVRLHSIGLKGREKVNFLMLVETDSVLLERWPHWGFLPLEVPGEEDDLTYWMV